MAPVMGGRASGHGELVSQYLFYHLPWSRSPTDSRKYQLQYHGSHDRILGKSPVQWLRKWKVVAEFGFHNNSTREPLKLS